MNILVFNWRDPKHSWAGGGEIYIFEQAKRWVKMGHEVKVFCGQNIDKKLPSFEQIDGIKIHRKGGRYSLYIWAIWYYFTHFRGGTDIIIDVQNGIPFFSPIFSRLPKVCFVYHIHAKQFFYEVPPPLNYIGYAVEKFIFPLLYKNLPIVAISKTTKKELIKIGFDKNKIYVVYCGMNTSNSNDSTKKFSQPTVLYLGRIKKYKRVGLLVNIFQKIVERVPKAHLIIAGWGTEASHLADIIMMSQLRRKISLVGPVSNQEKKNLLSKSWLFVNPSIGEGWSIAVIEANVYGTPAVSLNVSGLSESIQNGKTGLLAKDEEDLVNKICLLLSDKKLCNTLGNNARKWAKKFDWDSTASQSIHLLEKIYKTQRST